MKSILPIAVPFVYSFSLFALGMPDGVNSEVSAVVVYPNHAQVTRAMSVEAKGGLNVVKFTGLPSILNPHSLRATVSPGARITGTETKSVLLKESLSGEIKLLEDEIETLTHALEAEKRSLERWKEERAFYASIKNRTSSDLGKELKENRISVEDWKRMLTFVRDGLSECDEAMSGIDRTLRDSTEALEVLKNQHGKYAQSGPKEMKEVLVSFHSGSAGGATVRIHYIVPFTAWVPIYDVHLDRGSKRVRIIGYGQVTQWTGEPWKDVQLSFAMTRPDFELALPKLETKMVSFDALELEQIARDLFKITAAPLKQAKEWSKTQFKREQDRENFRRNLEQLLLEDEDRLRPYGLNRKLIRAALSRLVDRFAGVRYDLAQKETIPCDGSTHKVVIFSAEVPVNLKYVATPALGDVIMLKGDIKNSTGHPILAGGISMFVDNAYAGVSKIPSAAQNEGLTFCFGPDDTLAVERALIDRTVKGPEQFRQSQVITYEYCIRVENFGGQVACVEVMDQIPLSNIPEIQVDFLTSNLESKLDEQTGSLKWVLDVEPGQGKDISFSFSIECPVDKTVHWR